MRTKITILLVALVALTGACSDDDVDEAADTARDAAGTIADAAQDASARSVAEAYRAALLSDESDGANRRRVDVLQETADDLPGNPEILGIEDADGDGADDDGRVELRVDNESSCLTISAEGDTDIEDC
jgi:hypothetical protein